MYGLPKEDMFGALNVRPFLANQLDTTLIISYNSNGISDSFNQQVLASTALNITFWDGQNRSITQLDKPLTVCLSPTLKPKKGDKVCLSYYEERKGKWICEDECLTTVASKGTNASNRRSQIENLLCGQTDHLTNFALLLSGSEKEDQDPCGSSKDNTLAWVSLGMVGGAILLVALSAVAVEFYIRWRQSQLNRQLEKLFTQQTA